MEKYFETTRWNGADIDIFLVGLPSPEVASRKLEQLMDYLTSQLPAGDESVELAFVRTPNTVTMVSGDPRRHIQIITRLYNSPTQLLNGFDIDCCCVGFDGKNVMATHRGVQAIRQVSSQQHV